MCEPTAKLAVAFLVEGEGHIKLMMGGRGRDKGLYGWGGESWPSSSLINTTVLCTAVTQRALTGRSLTTSCDEKKWEFSAIGHHKYI